MQAIEVKGFLESRLPDTRVEVQGQGCDFQLKLYNDELFALTPVKRQQRVYALLNPWILDGTIHAVSMAFFAGAPGESTAEPS